MKRIIPMVLLVAMLFNITTISGEGNSNDTNTANTANIENSADSKNAANAAANASASSHLSEQAAIATPGGDFAQIADNTRYTLYFNRTNCFLSVFDKQTGSLWESNPQHAKDDVIAQGIAKTNLMSQLLITYTTAAANQKITNSFASSISRGAAKISAIAHGVRVDYQFKNEKIVIPVTYELEEDGLVASILFSEIQETGNNKLNDIEFLQYFGAASQQDTGYMVIPDGSGAVIRFNNNKAAFPAYSKRIYDEDLAGNTPNKTSRMEKISLPVFGVVKNGQGFLAEVTSGAELANMNASISGKTSSYNNINTMVRYRVTEKISMLDQILSSSKDVLFSAIDTVTLPKYSVKYSFLSAEKASYTGMAEMYRDILSSRGMKKSTEFNGTLFAEFYGGITRTKSFIGILYEGKEILTSFSQAQEILEDLKKDGVNNIIAGYKNYSTDFFKRKPDVKIQPVGYLGGRKGFTSLMKYAEENHIPLYPSADFTTMYRGGNGFSTFNDVSMAINITPVLVWKASLNTNMKDTGRKPHYLLKSNLFMDAAAKISASMNKIGSERIYLDQSANHLYSDFGKGGYQRDRAKEEYMKAFTELNKNNSLVFSNPNAYAYSFADYITDLPMGSSENLIFDYDIPFVSMILKGYIQYSGKAVNITDTSTEYFLKHIENGANLKYALIHSDGDVLLRTGYNYLYGATYSNISNQIKERCAILDTVQSKTKGATIVLHERKDNAVKVTYSNGTVLYINYNDKAVSMDAVTVPAEGYIIR